MTNICSLRLRSGEYIVPVYKRLFIKNNLKLYLYETHFSLSFKMETFLRFDFLFEYRVFCVLNNTLEVTIPCLTLNL